MKLALCIVLVAITAQVSLLNAMNTVEDAFLEHSVVHDVIDAPPKKFLSITYPDTMWVKGGNELTPTQVQNKPWVYWDASPDEFYTLLMTDPDAPSRERPILREFKHWLVINIPGNDISGGEELAAYVGAGPPRGSGLHRYVFLVFRQPSRIDNIELAHISAKSRDGRVSFNTRDFAKKYKLGRPIAGNFFQAEYDDYVPLLREQLSSEK